MVANFSWSSVFELGLLFLNGYQQFQIFFLGHHSISPMERICENCRLFDGQTSTCKVRVLVAGHVYRDIPVLGSDTCIYEDLGVADYSQEVRFKVQDPITGEPATTGKVTIEYPTEFFGAP